MLSFTNIPGIASFNMSSDTIDWPKLGQLSDPFGLSLVLLQVIRIHFKFTHIALLDFFDFIG